MKNAFGHFEKAFPSIPTQLGNHGHLPIQPPADNKVLTFFKNLWGENIPNGFLVVWTKQDMKAYFFHTSQLGDVASKVHELKQTQDVYFSLGIQEKTMDDPYKRGSAQSVVSIPGLWFDFDISGPGHVKNNLPPNAEALIAFIQDELPLPTFSVNSGGGLHCYWKFQKALLITNEDQNKSAKMLSSSWHKCLIEKGHLKGWHFDNTSAINHLLRIPGTINQKYGKEVIVCQNSGSTYAENEFSKYAQISQPSVIDIERANSSTERLEVSKQRQPTTVSSLTELVDYCEFLVNCRDHSLILSEPEWHKMVCILANEEGGPALIHKLSEPYPRYNKEKTDKKISNAILKNPGPITCATLKTMYNCNRDCGVTSPIHLLRKQPTSPQPIVIPASQQSLMKEPDEDEMQIEHIEWSILNDRVPDYRFPWEVFPLMLSESLKDLSKDMSINPELCGVIALGVLSSAIGATVRHVQSKKGYDAPLNLWIAIIAETGDKKTPVLNRLMKPIYKIQKQIAAKFEQQQAQNQNQSKQQQSTKQPERPPSLFTTDPTIEALIKLLAENPKGILLFQDELSSFLLNFERYKKGGGDREQYLNLWSGTQVKVDRVSKQLYVPDPFLSLLGGIQPRKAVKVFGERSFDDGLISRFLFFNNEHKADLLTDHKWSIANERLWNELVRYFYSLGVGQCELLLTKAGWDVFMQSANSLKRLSQYVPFRFRVFIPKAENYILRIAGVLHLVENVLSGAVLINPNVSADTVMRAVKLVYFFLGQARQVVELYGPRIKKLDRDYVAVIDAILGALATSKTNSVPMSEIITRFNNLVPAEAAIKSSQKFGSLVRRVLTDLSVDYDKKRQTNTSGKLAQHILISDSSKKKLFQLQKEQQ